MSAAPRLVLVASLAPLLVLATGHATRASAPAGRYVDRADGTVLDTKTKLTWQKSVPRSPSYVWGSAGTPGTAQNYCATLTLPGQRWRLPTVNELQTLVDYSQTGLQDGGSAAMIDSLFFPDTPPDVFWSSTPFSGFPDFAWGINFALGNSNGYDGSSMTYVRCVR